jgi:hypothetical protein
MHRVNRQHWASTVFRRWMNFSMPVALHAAADDGAVQHVQGSKQHHRPEAALLERQAS